MTRMWTQVPPKLMCRNHLLGEKNEIHKAIGGLLHHPHGLAIILGQVKDSNLDFSQIYRRYNQLSVEMENRGYKHDTTIIEHWGFLQYFEQLGQTSSNNQQELTDRCEKCRNRFKKFQRQTTGLDIYKKEEVAQ